MENFLWSRNYKRTNSTATYKQNNREIQTLDCVTFLGIRVDHRLDWRHHIDFLASKIASCCYALKVIAVNVGEQTAKIAYHAYVHSRLRYGIIFWGESVEAGRILVLQKRCIRNIFNLNSQESCKTKFKESKILTLVSTYILEAVMFVKDNEDLFLEARREHSHNTRNKQDLKNVKCNFTFIQKNVNFNLIKIFNKLPLQLRVLKSKKLKKTLKTILIEKCYYSIKEFLEDKNFFSVSTPL